MGVLSDAAVDLFRELKLAGVQPILATWISDACYTPKWRRHRNAPTVVVGRAEAYGMVLEALPVLRHGNQPELRMYTLVHLCRALFGDDDDQTLRRGYHRLGSQICVAGTAHEYDGDHLEALARNAFGFLLDLVQRRGYVADPSSVEYRVISRLEAMAESLVIAWPEDGVPYDADVVVATINAYAPAAET